MFPITSKPYRWCCCLRGVAESVLAHGRQDVVLLFGTYPILRNARAHELTRCMRTSLHVLASSLYMKMFQVKSPLASKSCCHLPIPLARFSCSAPIVWGEPTCQNYFPRACLASGVIYVGPQGPMIIIARCQADYDLVEM